MSSFLKRVTLDHCNMNELKKSLFAKYKVGALAHFYILSTSLDEENSSLYLNQWTTDFMSEILKDQLQTQSDERINSLLNSGHCDVAHIKTEEKAYTIKSGEFEEFFNFLKYEADQLKRKFIFVHDAHKISDVIANKLLKTLESPPVETTIFLLNPTNTTLLQTINSRAIKLKVNPRRTYESRQLKIKSFNQWNEELAPNLQEQKKYLSQYLNGELSMHVFVDLIKEKTIDEKTLFSLVTRWHCATQQPAHVIDKTIEYLKLAQVQRPFNGPAQNRVIYLLNEVFQIN